MNNMERIERFISEAMAGKADNTVKAYRYSLAKFAEFLEGSGTDLNGYGRTDVQQYIASMQSAKRSASGVNREIAAVKAYSRYAGKSDAVEALRMTKPPKATQKAPEWLSRNKVNEVLRITDRKRNKRDHAIVCLLLYAGLRVSELAALDRDDVELGERKGSVYVRSSKNGSARVVPLNSEVRKAINDYLEQRNDKIEALFLSSLNKRLSVRSIQSMLNEFKIKPHNFRHTFIKSLVDKNVPTATIQALSGHSSADMISWYSQPSDEDLANAVENLFD